MSRFRIVQLCAVLTLAIAGCRSSALRAPTAPVTTASQAARPRAKETVAPAITPATSTPRVASASFSQPATPIEEAARGDAQLRAEGELSLPFLLEEVQARNPSLQAMVAAWRAAAARYPQVVALDDPMFMAMTAPASLDSSQVDDAYVFEGAQKVPWFGKRAARGRMAQAEANAAGQDVQETRLRLAEVTQVAFLDYYLVCRLEELNRRNVGVMTESRDTAQIKYRANQVTQRDILQAEVELAELDRQQVELTRMHTVAVARINTLLRQPPNAPLPPPPMQLASTPVSVDLEVLQHVAAQQRPDLAAIAARIRAEQAAVTLACKAHYPDGEFFGRYDSFWQPTSTQGDLQGQVGVRLNVPIYHGRLDAAVREAMLRVSQRRAEYEQKWLDVQYEVQTAYAQLEESRRSLALYSERLLPAAEQNVTAARADYDVGKGSFLDLALAQRQLIELRAKHVEAVVDYHRRVAELNRTVGGSMPATVPEEIPAPVPRG